MYSTFKVCFLELSEILFFNTFYQWLVEFMDVELMDAENHLNMKLMWTLIYLVTLIYTDVFSNDSKLQPKFLFWGRHG